MKNNYKSSYKSTDIEDFNFQSMDDEMQWYNQSLVDYDWVVSLKVWELIIK